MATGKKISFKWRNKVKIAANLKISPIGFTKAGVKGKYTYQFRPPPQDLGGGGLGGRLFNN